MKSAKVNVINSTEGFTISNTLSPRVIPKSDRLLAKKFAMLVWDVEAYTYLVPVYERKGQDQKIRFESIQFCSDRQIERLSIRIFGVLYAGRRYARMLGSLKAVRFRVIAKDDHEIEIEVAGVGIVKNRVVMGR